MTPKLMVVIPTYNEAEALPVITEQIFELPIESLNLLVVDDNSPDGTGAIAEELAAKHPGRMFVLHRTDKRGFGPSYVDGFKRAIELGAELIIQMDADGSHQPKYISDLITAMEKKNADVVIGSRFTRGGGVDETWHVYRKMLSWFANRVYVKTLLGIDVADATGGFRIWKRNTLIGLDLDRVRSSGYVFQVETAYVASRLGYKVSEVPIYFPDRKLGISKMSARIQLEAAMRVWEVIARHRRLNPRMRRTEPYAAPTA